ncbi:CRISPR-associated Csx2 family protein [Desulfomicrobium macestii]|uniref:CRISPR-associated Csx2 family protein n=1 Tax=Desulfomicrobium macestii TaxID=90731 RepID=A0ABR9H7D5_9BACT|nr:TIGR02221 family CRISPR-associated protein [Desulfomicrobium macestii]MBE1426625.1 CRISPR-associated Csx2 family protein [Desulfomicrobium macestii]
MSKVFISFLGTGSNPDDSTKIGYDEVSYSIGDKTLPSTHFAQRAILEYHHPASFDRIHIFMTEQSRIKHWTPLRDQLLSLGAKEDALRDNASLTTRMDSEDQWQWFEILLDAIQDDDDVIMDFTHGFRSVPIVFSSAIGFLQKARKFRLLHAYYGYVEKENKTKTVVKAEIVDMAGFYRINDWADAVARLTETADASKLAMLAEEEKGSSFEALNDQKLIEALQSLTDLIKNIDVNRVGTIADAALGIIEKKIGESSGANLCLLEMVRDKFGELACQQPPSGRYDEAYFRTQLILAEMLLKHHLPMQAFTVMRECVASIGMLGVQEKYTKKCMLTKEGRGYRRRFGEVFASMSQYPKADWKFEKPEEALRFTPLVINDYKHLKPFWEQLEELGIAEILQGFFGDMAKLRNGFDHAWIIKNGVPANVIESGKQYLEALKTIFEKLREAGLLPLPRQ